MKKPFDKPSLSFPDQLEKLMKRGLVVEDEDQAIHSLSHLNYYRFAAYALPFQENGTDHQFKNGTKFETILNHYQFDSNFRALLMRAIEKIEISFRTQWAYHFSQKYGAHCYTIENESIVRNNGRLRSYLERLNESVKGSDEEFIKHNIRTYEEEYPPAWVACEVMSLGLISRFYSNMRAYQVRKNIANAYDFDEGFLEGFMEHLTYVRNVCAHHGRIWNRHLSKKMPLVRNKPSGLRDNLNIDNDFAEHRIYNTLVIINYLLHVINPNSNWSSSLVELIFEYEIDTVSMGFPVNWQDLEIWS